MVNNLIRDIEQAMFNTLTNEQLSQLRTVLEYSFRNIEIVEKGGRLLRQIYSLL